MNKSDKEERLILPPVIYASVGNEMNLYFDNVFLCLNPRNYAFEFHCGIGRCDDKRWHCIPAADDIGIHAATLRIWDESGIAAEGRTRIMVSDPAVKKECSFRLLMIGDSWTDQTHFPSRVHSLCLKHEFNITMLGTNCPEELRHDPFQLIRYPAPERLKGVRHEGWGGWAWGTFLHKTKTSAKKNPKPWDIPSRFLVIKDGKGKLDFQAYLDKYNEGKAPDFITVQLGVNDIFAATDENLEEKIKKILASADTLLAEFRRVAPNAKIGVGLVTPSARSQDAFGTYYTCGQTRWQYRKNQHRLNEAYLKKFTNHPDKDLSIIPTNVNLDCENNFPVVSEPVNVGNPAKITRQSNGVHPASAGYRQIGDTFYCWLKYQLSNSGKAK